MCLSVTSVSPAKTNELIEVLFVVWTDPPLERGSFLRGSHTWACPNLPPADILNLIRKVAHSDAALATSIAATSIDIAWTTTELHDYLVASLDSVAVLHIVL